MRLSQVTVASNSTSLHGWTDTPSSLGVSVTAGETREPTQFDHLQGDVEVFADLDSPIRVFDRGYLDYDRFCALKEREEDFVCLLQSDSRVDVLDSL